MVCRENKAVKGQHCSNYVSWFSRWDSVTLAVTFFANVSVPESEDTDNSSLIFPS